MKSENVFVLFRGVLEAIIEGRSELRLRGDPINGLIELLEFVLDVHAFEVFYFEVRAEQYLINKLLEVLHGLVVISIEPVNELIVSIVGE